MGSRLGVGFQGLVCACLGEGLTFCLFVAYVVLVCCKVVTWFCFGVFGFVFCCGGLLIYCLWDMIFVIVVNFH